MLAVMVALALAAPGGALASHRQAMILQDDATLIYASPQSVSATLQTLKNMGVDRVGRVAAARAQGGREPEAHV